ncbi:MAG: ABC transporter ATP-binding protein [Cryobacterium sp.]|nr:ABC transporter ATP-binding protein [Cryobacterium sp.]
MPTAPGNKLEIKNVFKTFVTEGSFGSNRETVALEDVNFHIREGEFVTLIGPSGSGKSTLLMIIAGLFDKTSGDVLLDGKQVVEPGIDRGVVFQDFALFPWLTVEDNIRFGLRKRGLSRAEADATIAELLELVSLTGFGKHRPHELSGGMKQRVAIARAFAGDPELLLMDEPFGALDAQTRSSLQREFQEIWQRTGKTVLFVTHSVREAVYLSDRVIVLSSRPGRVASEVTIDLPRPRAVFDPEFAEVERQVAMELAAASGSGSDISAFSD